MTDPTYSTHHTIEIEWGDGTVARWAIPNDDDRIDDVAAEVEGILGPPDTLRA